MLSKFLHVKVGCLLLARRGLYVRRCYARISRRDCQLLEQDFGWLRVVLNEVSEVRWGLIVRESFGLRLFAAC